MAVKTKDAQKIKVANTEITIGDVYEVTPKKDYSAPTGFQEYGTTKILHSGVKEVRGIPYDEEKMLFDTGFDEDSTCNRSISKEAKTATVNAYNTLVKEPYQKMFRVDASSHNDEFWLSYTYEVYTGKVFETSKPKDLFDLFHALQQGRLAEPGEKDSSIQRTANYCIKNNKKVQSLKEEKSENKFRAVATYMTLVDAFDPKKDDKLYSILEWNQATNIRGIDKEALKRLGYKMFDHDKLGYENAVRFLEAYGMSQTDKGLEKLEMYSILSKLYNRNKIEYKRSQYHIDGMLLGNHLKEAVEVVLQNNEIKKIVEAEYGKIA